MLRPGKYWVGDLCYVMHPQWDEVCKLMFATNGNGVLNGEFNLANGVRFAQHGTAYGDGTYYDDQGRAYPVDAGLIGCIRVDDIQDDSESKWLEGGNVVDFDKPFEITYNNGVIKIGHIEIDTDPEYNNEEDEDYDEEEV